MGAFLGGYVAKLYASTPARLTGAVFAAVTAFGIALSPRQLALWVAVFLLGVVVVQVYVAYKDFRAPVRAGDAVSDLIRQGFQLEETLRRTHDEKEARVAVMAWIVEAHGLLLDHAPEYRKDFSSQEAVDGSGTGRLLALVDRDIKLLSQARKEIGAR